MREGEVFRRAYVAQQQAIEAQGLTLDYTLGANDWRTFMDHQKLLLPDCPDLFVSTAFCPRVHPVLNTSNAHSFVVYDANGRSVAGVVVRSYPHRLKHLLEHGQLWLPDADVLASDFRPDDALFAELRKQVYTDPENGVERPLLDAYVTQRGGLFVSPDYRQHGLGSALSIISNVCAFRLFDSDWTVALKRQPYDPWSSGCAYLGEAEIDTPRIKFWLAWYSRGDAVEQFRSALGTADIVDLESARS